MLNLAYLMYIINYKPLFETSKLEIFNEISTLIINIMMIINTNYVKTCLIKYYCGYAITGVFCLNMTVNFLLILLRMIRRMILFIKKTIRRLRRKHKPNIVLKKSLNSSYKFLLPDIKKPLNEEPEQAVNE